MGRIFGCSFTWPTVWLDDWHCRRIFGWLNTGASTYPLDSPNPGADSTGTLMGAPLGLWFVSDVFWGVGIYCVPPFGAFITYKINSVRYCHLVEFLTLSLSTTWLIPTSGGRRIATELESTGSITFTMVMDEDSSILTDDLLG